MAYNITLSNGSVLASISDTTIDTTTSLTLLGKKYPKYGGIVAENFVYLLENFANSTSPIHPLKGQLWYDTTNSLLKLWNGTAWVSLVISGSTTTTNYLQMVEYAGDPNTHVAGVAATLLTPPSLCWDLTNNLLWICVTTGNASLAVWKAVAPLDSPVLTGNPTTPNQLISDNSGKISNTKFVNDFVTNYAAPKAGNSSQTFEVANATLSTEAVALGQIAGLVGNWAPVAGNPLQTFEVANATTSMEAVNLGQIFSLLATSGRLVLPNGLIIQWNKGVNCTNGDGTTNQNQTLSWSVPFPNAVLVSYVSTNTTTSSYAGDCFWQIYSTTTTDISVQLQNVGSNTYGTSYYPTVLAFGW